MKSVSRKSCILLWIALSLFVLFGICGLMTIIHSSERNVRWLGRGNGLRAIPYNITVGPVDTVAGFKGLMEPGQTKSQVESALGQPLVGMLPLEDRNPLMEEQGLDVFYQGVFAWVRYNGEGRVISLVFDLPAFRNRFQGEQQILISHKEHHYLLHEDLSLDQTVSMFDRSGQGGDIRVLSDSVIILGTGTSLVFSRNGQRLQEVVISIP